MKKRLSILCTLALLPCFASANTNSQISEKTLSNGLQVYVKVDTRAPVVVSQVWYKTGSAYETPGLSGSAHALEHMMFQGTPKFPEGKFMEIVSANGGDLNAFTSQDMTVYYEELASDRLNIAFELEADRMDNLNLATPNFAKEIQVVMEERRLRTDDSPESMLFERVGAASHLPAPYQHPTVGWMNDLQNMNVGDLRQFYMRWYAPNNAFIVVVGNVDPNEVFALAQKYFGNIPARTVPQLKPQLPPEFLGKTVVNVNLPAKLPLLVMGYNTPTLTENPKNTDPYALLVLANLLAGTDSSRLENDLVRGRELASNIDIGYSPYSLFADQLIIAATPTPAHSMEEVEAAITEEIATLQTIPVSEAELNRVKTEMIASHLYDQDDLSQQAVDLGQVIVVGLPPTVAEDYVTQIKAVTPAQIQAVAQRYLTENRLTVGYLHPLPLNATTEAAIAPIAEGSSHEIQ